MMDSARNSVLVVGVCLLDDPRNSAPHIVEELAQATEWNVDQRWVVVGHGRVPDSLRPVAVEQRREAQPKFTVINRLLAQVELTRYRYVIVCDDDILLPHGFLDAYLKLVEAHAFALAQPARTRDSYIDHAFVGQIDGIVARRTNFVEIGPCFSIRNDAFKTILPFDNGSPMGWGFDLVWPRQLADEGMALGIIDATPISHSLRKPVSGYDHAGALGQMAAYLARHPHISRHEAFFIHESYA